MCSSDLSERTLYPSQWFILGGTFWFAWIFSASYYLLVLRPLRGVTQAVVNEWFINGISNLWLAPMAIAFIYYILPKSLKKELYSRELAAFAFWVLAIFGAWSGLAGLIGGPVPHWMASSGAGSKIALLAAAIATAWNCYQTMGGFKPAAGSPAIAHFAVFGLYSYLIGSVVDTVCSTYRVSELTQFTLVRPGLQYLLVLGFFGLSALGLVYHAVAQMTESEWQKPKWIGGHLGFAIIGALVEIGRAYV